MVIARSAVVVIYSIIIFAGFALRPGNGFFGYSSAVAAPMQSRDDRSASDAVIKLRQEYTEAQVKELRIAIQELAADVKAIRSKVEAYENIQAGRATEDESAWKWRAFSGTCILGLLALSGVRVWLARVLIK